MKKILTTIILSIAGILTVSALSVYMPIQGGTGTSTKPTIGQVLVGQSNGTYSPQATSTLGISSGISSPLTTKGDIWGYTTTNARIPVGSNGYVLTASSTSATGLAWTAIGGSGTVTSVDMTTPTGLTVSGNPITTSGTLGLSLTSGYNIPLTASTTNWNTVFDNSGNYVTYTYASSTFPSFTYASSTFMTNPMTTLGDIIYGGASGVGTRLEGNTSTNQKFLTQTGDGVNAGAPSWQVIPAQGNLTYYFATTTSDVSGYYNQIVTPSTVKQTIATTSVSTTKVLANFETTSNTPNLGFIPAGVYEVHVHVSSTNPATGQVYAEIWETDASGVDIGLIGTTESTSVLGGLNTTETEYRLHFTDANVYNMTSTSSRIVTRVWFQRISATHDVTLYVGDGADAHTSLPSNTVDATNFVPYTGAVYDIDINSKNFTTTGKISSTNASSTALTATTLYSTTHNGGSETLSGTLGVTGHTTLTTASSTALTVSGNTTLVTTTITKATITNASTTNQTLSGSLFDSVSNVGNLGMVLQSTGTSTLWVATSSLGISGGSGGGGGGITWTSINATTTMSVDTGYITASSSLNVLVLPTSASVGKVVRIAGSGAGGWRLNQNASQVINFGDTPTTTGTSGYILSTDRYDAIELLCIGTDNVWTVISSNGVLDVN